MRRRFMTRVDNVSCAKVNAMPILLSRLRRLHKYQCDRDCGRQRRQLHSNAPRAVANTSSFHFHTQTKPRPNRQAWARFKDANASLNGEARCVIASLESFTRPYFAWQLFICRPMAPNFCPFLPTKNLLMNLLIL
jgi:hypothetical protein